MNYLRLLGQLVEAELVCVVDTNSALKDIIKHKMPVGANFYTDYKTAIDKESLDAVIVSTPLSAHFEICKYALNKKVNVLCEKPVSNSYEEILELKHLSATQNLLFFPGHVFIYNQGIQFIREFLQSGDFGKVYYMNFQRTGLGPFRTDANVIEDLATHDFSIILSLMKEKPHSISMTQFNYESPELSDAAYITLYFPSKIHVTIQTSWLHPIKERKMSIIGSHMMILFDDTSVSEKVKLFKRDRPYNLPPGDFGEFQMALRGGEIHVPDIKYSEPLKALLSNFINSILGLEQPVVSIDEALAIAKIFVACNESAASQGKLVSIPL